MYIADVHDYTGSDEHEGATKPFLSQGQRKAITGEIEQIIESEFDRMEDFANEYISRLAAERAEKFLEKVIGGDKDAALALLGERSDGRHDNGTPWAKLIHGKLYEIPTFKLRRQIVEAHADLIKAERIKDLESIVEGLSQQVRELEKRNDELCR